VSTSQRVFRASDHFILVCLVCLSACGDNSRDGDHPQDALFHADARIIPLEDAAQPIDANARKDGNDLKVDAQSGDAQDGDAGNAQDDAQISDAQHNDGGRGAFALRFEPLPATVESGEPIVPAVQVSIRDQAGAVVTTSSVSVELALESHASGARIRGTLRVAAIQGIATFDDLSIDRTAADLVLVAEAPEISATGRSSRFSSVVGPARKLAFISQPTNATVRTSFSIVVAVTNWVDEVVESSTATINLRLLPPSTRATLSGAAGTQAVGGRALVSLSVDLDGRDYMLEASASGLVSATSTAFDVARLRATDGLGHLEDELFDPEQYAERDFPNDRAFGLPRSVALDPVGHRLFVSDRRGQRVLIFQLSANNDFTGVDRRADQVLTTDPREGVFEPHALAFDRTTGFLIVSQRYSFGRIFVFDVSALTSGPLNPRFLFGRGQAAGATYGPAGLAIDEPGRRLFVADAEGRVLVFDLNNLQDGMSASNVLGRPDFVSTGRTATTQALTTSPEAVAFDALQNRLYVADGNRVLVFDTNSIVDGENAISVLGAPDFVTRPRQPLDAATIGGPIQGLTVDQPGNRLYVADAGERILVFDTTNVRNGMNATAVLGWRDFTTPPVFHEVGVETAGSGVRMGSILGSQANSGTLEARVRFRSPCRIRTALDGNACGRNDIQVDVEGRVVSTISACGSGAATSVIRSPGVLLPHRWYHIARTWTSTSHKLFVDGALVAEASKAASTINSGGLNLMVGVRHEDGFSLGEGFFGEIAEARVWTVARSSAEVLAGLAGPVTPGPTLLGYWKFDETGGTTAADSSGNNHRGVLYGSASFSATSSISRSRIQIPQGMAFDETNRWLWLADAGTHRVTSYDTAQLTNGMNATDGLGHLDHGAMNFERASPGDIYSAIGLSEPGDVVIDRVRHRAFVSDKGNERVLVYQLSPGHDFFGRDRVADFVLGQPNFETVEERADAGGMAGPTGLAYDAVRDRLFVADTSNNRILVFDTSTLTNGQSAFAIIGQASGCARSRGIGPDRLTLPEGLDYDETTGFLYVADAGRRVLVFDTANLVTGMAASYVLGAPDFASIPADMPSSRTFSVRDVAVDPFTRRLHVVGPNRVLVFDVSMLSNDASASFVLGTSRFNDYALYPECRAWTFFDASSVVADGAGERLFVFGEYKGQVFDTASLANGMSASNVFGYEDFLCNGRGLGAETVNHPRGGTFDPISGSLFLADTDNHRILIIPMP
jgi:DNA-binding beta-propeller fold protein YncE